MKKARTLLIATALLGASATLAGPLDFNTQKPNVFSYNYIDGGYIDRDGDLDGFGLRGAYDIKPNLAVIGSFSLTSADYPGGSVDLTTFSIGAAHHYKFENQTLPNSDLVLSAEFIRYSSEATAKDIFGQSYSASADDSGFRIGAQLRHRLQPQLELNGGISFETTDGNDIIISPGFAYDIQNNISIVGTYDLADADQLFIGARLYY